MHTTSKVMLVLELVSGFRGCRDLTDLLLSRGGPITEAEARPIFAQLISAVAFLHAHGVVHRDIKCAFPRSRVPRPPA